MNTVGIIGGIGPESTIEYYRKIVSSYCKREADGHSFPDEVDQCYIHDKYMGELVKGIILDETRSGLINVIDKMKHKHDVQGLILGGTELPLILKEGDVTGIHILDTTEIHVESILETLK